MDVESLAPYMWEITLVAISAFLAFFMQRIGNILKYFARYRGLSKRVSGDWYVYHLTRNLANDPEMFWTSHHINLKVRRWLTISGTDRHPDHDQDYIIRGQLYNSSDILLRIENKALSNDVAYILLDNLLNNNFMVGNLTAKDYNKRLYSTAIVFSREEISTDEASTHANGSHAVKFLS